MRSSFQVAAPAVPLLAMLIAGAAPALCFEPAAAPAGELVFPLEPWHDHGSSLVEAPDGSLFVAWYHGSGERNADDVAILGARKRKGETEWSAPFELADTPGFPDTNCTLLVDPSGRLWLFWPTILANTWESALLKYKVSSDWLGDGSPVWSVEKVLHMKPGERFPELVKRKTEELFVALGIRTEGGDPASERARAWAAHNDEQAADKLTRRLGWFTRAHPVVLDGTRLLVGLYSDGFSFGGATYTDDWGATWTMSEPIVGLGAVQPSFARRRDGSLVAFLRDNGPPPKHVQVAESRDLGETWSIALDHPDLIDSGAGVDALVLASGRWLLVHNDVADGRYRLAVSVSEDEGRTFPRHLYLERVTKGEGRFHYPSSLQARDGSIHVSYSYHLPPLAQGAEERETIKHVRFEESWLLDGDGPPGSR